MIRVFGLNHQTAPIDVRERIAVGDSELRSALLQLGSGVILSTCNRTEIYVPSADPTASAQAKDYFKDRLSAIASADLPPIYDLEGVKALRHLFAVAAGLDSMVIGEQQILGQIRVALSQAIDASVAGPILTRVFRDAIRVGRRARHETFIARHSLSISYAAVELARRTLGDLRGLQVLVVGAGETGELTARALVENGVGVFAVANRTLDRATALANQYGGVAAPLTDIATLLQRADIVISSTEAPHYVITRGDIAAAMADRGDRPLFIVDIALPRDVEPAARSIPGVQLHDLDDLRALCEHNLDRRRKEIQKVQALIDDEASQVVRWWDSLDSIPLVIDLRAHADRIRRDELQQALGQLSHLTDADRAVIQSLSRAIVNKLLHNPTVKLKSDRRVNLAGLQDLTRELFGLE